MIPRRVMVANRLFWLIAIWAISVATVAASASLIKLLMNLAGLTVRS
jgi:hypothetical protein